MRRRPWYTVIDARAAALLALALSLPSLFTGLQNEDRQHAFMIRSHRGWGTPLFGVPRLDLERLAREVQQRRTSGQLPWLVSDDWNLAFYRPLSALTHEVDHRLFPNSPWLMHVHSLLWLGLFVWLGGKLLARFVLPGRARSLALAALAASGCLHLVAGWLANRNALISGSFVLASTLCFAQRSPTRRGLWEAGAVVTALLGLCAGETGLGVLGWWCAILILDDAPALRRRRWRLAAVLGALALLYVAGYRAAGWGARGAGAYLSIGAPSLELVVEWARRTLWLVAGALGPIGPDGYTVFSRWSGGVVALVVSVAIALLIGALVVIARSRAAYALLGALVLGSAPSALAMPADRMLLLGAPAVAGLGAIVVKHVLRSRVVRNKPPRRRTVWKLGVAYWIVGPTLGSPVRAATYAIIGGKLGETRAQMEGALDNTTQVAVLLNGHTYYSLTQLGVLRRGDGAHVKHVGIVGDDGPVSVTRSSERSLRVTVPRGFVRERQNEVYRPRRSPLPVGRIYELPGIHVTVLQPTNGSEVVDLSPTVPDDRVVLICFDGDRFRRWTPPPIGETVELRASCR